jgi:DNA mismatch repair ATPase MutL
LEGVARAVLLSHDVIVVLWKDETQKEINQRKFVSITPSIPNSYRNLNNHPYKQSIEFCEAEPVLNLIAKILKHTWSHKVLERRPNGKLLDF